MKWQTIPNFGLGGVATIMAGDFVAVGIAACSDVDTCSVGELRLGPQSLIECAAGRPVKPLRGYRTYGGVPITNNLETQGGAPGGQVGATLVLQLYEPCDALQPPGPRAPVLVSGYLKAADLPTTNATAALLLRLPFMGRRCASITVKRAENIDLSVILHGVRYLDPNGRYAQGKDAALVHFSRERAGFTWFTTGPVETRQSDPAGTQALFIDIQPTASGTDGTMDFHCYDEIDVWVFGAAGAAAIYGAGEAWGERF